MIDVSAFEPVGTLMGSDLLWGRWSRLTNKMSVDEHRAMILERNEFCRQHADQESALTIFLIAKESQLEEKP